MLAHTYDIIWGHLTTKCKVPKLPLFRWHNLVYTHWRDTVQYYRNLAANINMRLFFYRADALKVFTATAYEIMHKSDIIAIKWLMSFSKKETAGVMINVALNLWYKKATSFKCGWHPSLLGNHLPSKVWNGVTYQFPKFNACFGEVWECVWSNSMSRFRMDAIT